MLFSTFFIISITAYSLFKLFKAKKLEKKSSSFLDLREFIQSLTFINFFSCCVMYFLCLYYISPYYIFIISSLGCLSFDTFVSTSGLILKFHPALKSMHVIFEKFNISNFKRNTPFLYLHEIRLSGPVDKLVTEIRPPVSLNKNIAIQQEVRPLSYIASLLIDRGVFKESTLYVKPCSVLSAVSGKNLFSISSDNGDSASASRSNNRTPYLPREIINLILEERLRLIYKDALAEFMKVRSLLVPDITLYQRENLHFASTYLLSRDLDIIEFYQNIEEKIILLNQH